MALFNRTVATPTTDAQLDEALSTAGNALATFLEAATELDVANDALDEVEARTRTTIDSFKAAIEAEESRLTAVSTARNSNTAAAAKIREIFSL